MPMYWGDYARDTGHLDATSHGAYLMLIKHYWCTGEPLVDDDDELWRVSCCDSKRDWLRIRPRVVRFFKQDDGLLRHDRVDRELAKAMSITGQRRVAGLASAKARREANENSTHVDTPVELPSQQNAVQLQPQSQREEKSTPLRGVSKAGQKPKTACDPNWRPTQAGLNFAAERNVNISAQIPKFIDHHTANGKAMADWDAAWRTWCRNEIGWRPNGQAGKPTSMDATQAIMSFDDPNTIEGFSRS